MVFSLPAIDTDFQIRNDCNFFFFILKIFTSRYINIYNSFNFLTATFDTPKEVGVSTCSDPVNNCVGLLS